LAFGAGVTAAVMVGGVVSAATARPAPDRKLTPRARHTLRRIRLFRLSVFMNPPEHTGSGCASLKKIANRNRQPPSTRLKAADTGQ
jgi:hypothetical protein